MSRIVIQTIEYSVDGWKNVGSTFVEKGYKINTRTGQIAGSHEPLRAGDGDAVLISNVRKDEVYLVYRINQKNGYFTGFNIYNSATLGPGSIVPGPDCSEHPNALGCSLSRGEEREIFPGDLRLMYIVDI